MNATARAKVKTLQEKLIPNTEPIRVALHFVSPEHGHPETIRYGENIQARNLRYKARVDRGYITLAEYEQLAAEPLQNGYFEMPEIDLPLIEV